MKLQSSKDTLQRLLPVILLIAGITVFGMGIGNLLRWAGYETTTAVIQEIAAASSAERAAGSPLYHVYVDYAVGEDVYTADVGSYKSGYEVGGELAVLYNPENPANAVVSDRKGACIMAVCGGVMLAADVVLLVPLLRAVLTGNKKKEDLQKSEE